MSEQLVTNLCVLGMLIALSLILLTLLVKELAAPISVHVYDPACPGCQREDREAFEEAGE